MAGLDVNLTMILKLMWDINKRVTAGKFVSLSEQVFYNSNLELIKDYYTKNSNYWKLQKPIKS